MRLAQWFRFNKAVGCLASLAMAVLCVLVPDVVALEATRSSRAATIFAVWPVLAFVLYIQICSPRFETTVFTVISISALVATPFVLAYK